MTSREESIKQLIKEQLRKAAFGLKGYKVFLFGSRATGTAKGRSDFDVGVYGKRPIPLKTFYTIEDLLGTIETLYSIELVDLNRVSLSFRKEAMKTAEIIYE